MSVNLPITGNVSAGHRRAVHEKLAAERRLADYDRRRASEEGRLVHTISKILGELKILESRIITFAENARKITSTSYELGQSSYLELLQAELKLQQFLLKRVALKAQLAGTRTALKYLRGEPLYDF